MCIAGRIGVSNARNSDILGMDTGSKVLPTVGGTSPRVVDSVNHIAYGQEVGLQFLGKQFAVLRSLVRIVSMYPVVTRCDHPRLRALSGEALVDFVQNTLMKRRKSFEQSLFVFFNQLGRCHCWRRDFMESLYNFNQAGH